MAEDDLLRVAKLGDGTEIEIQSVGFDARVDKREDRLNDGKKYSGLKSLEEYEVIREELLKDPEQAARDKEQARQEAEDRVRLKAEFERKERERKKKEKLQSEVLKAKDAGVGKKSKAKKAKKGPVLSFDDDEEGDDDE